MTTIIVGIACLFAGAYFSGPVKAFGARAYARIRLWLDSLE